jgi:hypothetical protein
MDPETRITFVRPERKMRPLWKLIAFYPRLSGLSAEDWSRLGLSRLANSLLYAAILFITGALAAALLELSRVFWEAQGAVLTKAHTNGLGWFAIFTCLAPCYAFVTGVAAYLIAASRQSQT